MKNNKLQSSFQFGIGALTIPLCSLSVLSLSSSCNRSVEKIQKPNVLFILVDDLGWKDLSCTGSDFYETPNVDTLASYSTVFSQGYAACSVSSPARASIMTGVYTAEHNITDWIGAPQGEEIRAQKKYTKMLPAIYDHSLKQGYTTIAEALKLNGYATYYYGKWHLGGVEQQSLPTDHGFEVNVGGYKAGSPGKGGYFSPYQNPFLKDGPNGENLSWRLASECAEGIKNHMKNHPDKPFFSMLSFYAVHAPLQTTKSYWKYFRDKADEHGYLKDGFKIDYGLPVRKYQDNPIYAGLISHMDDGVGIVLKQLKELGILDNTLIIFTGDNGGICSGVSSTSNLPLRGGKGTQWEGGIRVPFIIKEPHQKQHRVSDTPVCGIDFYPTILDYANINVQKALNDGDAGKIGEIAGTPEPDGGLVPQPRIDGVSIKPLVEGGEIVSRNLYWDYPHYSASTGGVPCAIERSGDWKLILYFEDNHTELYNLKNDPGEQKVLNTEYPAKVQKLTNNLKKWLKSTNGALPKNDPQYNAVLHKKYLENLKNSIKLREKNRLESLQENFKPNKDWWGSYIPD